MIDALTKGGLALKHRRPCVWSLRECYVPSAPPPTTHPSASQRARASSFPLAVLVGLYEEPEKPANALECAVAS